MRNDKVILATDADMDGMHIRNLMIMFVSKNTPERRDYIMDRLVVPVEE